MRLAKSSSIFFLIAFAASSLIAQTTRPATTAPTADATLNKWFNQLSDPDPKLREQARTDLMGIQAADLPRLRQLVADHQPLPPTVVSAVHEIVVQVFLANRDYTDLHEQQVNSFSRTGPFFLGILWHNDGGGDGRLGVSVDERLPGFPSYRYLREGDMILEVTTHPQQLANETHSIDELKGAIKLAPSVQDISLHILRNGEEMQIPISMAPRPMESGPPDEQPQNFPAQNHALAVRDFIAERMQFANDYWHENFDAVLEAQAGN